MKSKRTLLVLLDILAISFSFVLAVLIRFDSSSYSQYLSIYTKYIVASTLIKLFINYIFNLYNSLWEYASVDELIEIVMASIIGGLISAFVMMLTGNLMPRSMYVLTTFFNITLFGLTRFTVRIYRRLIHGALRRNKGPRILIIGAGAAGAMVLNEIRSHSGWKYDPIAFIDDDPRKKGKIINGIRVVGNRNDIIETCQTMDIDEIIIAIPAASKKDKQDIINLCSETKCKVKTLPGVFELINGKATISQIRDVEIIDLLGREEIKLNLDGLNTFIKDKRVMVTGGGGSIGSELCRQIAKFSPKEVLILDIYENTTYDIQNELLKDYKDLKLRICIGSVRDRLRIDEVIDNYKPQVVFHAAAHKHVPLMEDSPKDAVKNNVFGTLNVVQSSHKNGVEKFVLISTDKAVNPTNVMGATKRVCEMIVQAYNEISKTDFVAVRFGNVLGSNGSVIPLFKKQIQEGGPVNVTHKDVIRYFMTIPEACQLVLEAGSIAKGGEIFILDMGEPVKILDLAISLIKLSGLEPYEDIPIEIVGLRPGEKLYEELLLNKEVAIETINEKIFIEPAEHIDLLKLMAKLQRLEDEVFSKASGNSVKESLSKIVKGYKPFIKNDKKDALN